MGKHFALVLTEERLRKPITLEGISDGTLRFLLLLSILLNPQKGKLICIDEPEISLHPDMISILSEVINQSNREGTQLIIATHSPMLLNMFELEQVYIVEKDEKNSTVFVSKTEEEFSSWTGEFLPGRLWLQGLLGGRR
ncbi:MAG: AAA family ATPase [Saprospiraceae bacterium]|nr:AAA family ATPase [Saprospiraceae bacterium]